jgi:polyhydroxyalkanoate depolymerase
MDYARTLMNAIAGIDQGQLVFIHEASPTFEHDHDVEVGDVLMPTGASLRWLVRPDQLRNDLGDEAAYSTPFATPLRFKEATEAPQTRVLVVAPMSGHFATLLRATVKTMLTAHDVYITDWHNIRDVPVAEGRFNFSAFVGHLVEFLQVMRVGSHVVAVCQPHRNKRVGLSVVISETWY